MNHIIELLKECGEFCTVRSHPKLPWLRDQIEVTLKSDSKITIDRTGIKILTPSFIDEMISELALQYGLESIKKHVTFKPPLELIYEQQIERGIRLRREREE